MLELRAQTGDLGGGKKGGSERIAKGAFLGLVKSKGVGRKAGEKDECTIC